MTDERAEFEAWAHERGKRHGSTVGNYTGRDSPEVWEAWQARGAQDAARIAELERDAERLDWIEREKPQSIVEGDDRGAWEVWTRIGGLFYGSTVRDTIDRARSASFSAGKP